VCSNAISHKNSRCFLDRGKETRATRANQSFVSRNVSGSFLEVFLQWSDWKIFDESDTDPLQPLATFFHTPD